jgi:hypothetical protein
VIGGGLFVGYAWGAQSGLVYGAEAYGVYFLKWEENRCVSSPQSRYGVGPLLQIAAVPRDTFQITLAAQGGAEIAPGFASANVELGATHRFGVESGTGVHTGVSLTPFIANFAWRAEWGLDQRSFLAGLRFPPPFGPPRGSCIEGRPFRSQEGDVIGATTAPLARDGSRGARSERAKRAGAAWARDAEHECASVPAFLQLAAELLAHDAPVALAFRALDAASDEIAHARLCAQVASRYGGEAVRPVLPDFSFRPHLSGSDAYLRLAAESWVDGCLGEGVAAARAESAARSALDPVARAAKRRIARDEARHAELGWSVLEWAMHRGGSVVRDALASLRDAEIAAESGEPDLRRYGRLDSGQIRRTRHDVAARCRHRLENTLEKGALMV